MDKKVVGLVLVSSMLLLVGCSPQVKLEPKAETVEVEYGQAISTEAKDYFNNEDSVLSKVTLVKPIENEPDKEYIAVGEHILSFIYDGKENQPYEIKIVVKDTTAPVLTLTTDKVEFEYATDLSNYDWKQYVQIQDLSQTDVNVEEKC